MRFSSHARGAALARPITSLVFLGAVALTLAVALALPRAASGASGHGAGDITTNPRLHQQADIPPLT
ncbi:MAG: hypothetical protein WAO61_09470, partial [Solirubrobacterales bacterium]